MPVVAKIVYWKLKNPLIRDQKRNTFSVFYLCMAPLFQDNQTLCTCIIFVFVAFQVNKMHRAYSKASMADAYLLWEGGMSVYKAAKLTGVPKQTLRDRTCGRIAVTTFTSGTLPLFSKEEEQSLTQHVISVAMYGYGYTRFDLRCIATDMAVYLNKRKSDDKILGEHWLYGFLARNPTLKVKGKECNQGENHLLF